MRMEAKICLKKEKTLKDISVSVCRKSIFDKLRMEVS